MTRPLVSVVTLAYNQAPFIARCIEGALMQKTDFPFEIVIGEDCSTDGTRDIVFGYARRYPELIKTVTSDSNVGMAANAARTFQILPGAYIASCEGDDYWIDPLKLQKQYDAAVMYDAVLVVHGSIYLHHDGSKLIGRQRSSGKRADRFPERRRRHIRARQLPYVVPVHQNRSAALAAWVEMEHVRRRLHDQTPRSQGRARSTTSMRSCPSERRV